MRRRNVVLLWVAMFLVALVAFVLAWAVAGKTSIQTKLAAIRAQGYPTTPKELDAWYVEPPKGEDAADLYEEAFKLLKDKPGTPEALIALPLIGETDLPLSDQPLAPNVLALAESFLAERRDILDLLHDAAQLERARYTMDLTQGPEVDLTIQREHREAANLLALDAVVRAERGDAAMAAVRITDAVRLGESLAEEPLIMSQLTRIALHHIAVNGLKRVLNRQALEREQLEWLASAFAEAEGRDTFYRGLAGDRGGGLPAMLGEGPENRNSSPAEAFALMLNPVLARDVKWYLDRTSALIEASRGTDRERRAIAVGPTQSPPPYCMLSRVLLPALERTFEANLRNRAYLRAAQVVLAVEQYRIERGALPETLTALVPEYLASVPNDPCADAPLLYRRFDTGYVVYSIGLDAEDDGGIDIDEKKPGQSWRDLDYAVKVVR